jgi:dienelactone hydrolase
MFKSLTCLFVTIGLLAVAAPGRAQSYDVEDIRIAVPGAGPSGLEAVLVRPAGNGRNPLALVTNGSPRSADDRPAMTAMRQYPEALEFARRGFTAVAVLRRGYGTSGGGWAETYGTCGQSNYVAAGRAGAADLRAAIAGLAQRPDVDGSRAVAVGVSAGGFATVALAAEPPPGLVAAISFAGGRGSRASDSVCDADRLVAAFGTFGRTARIPMLWVYAANDHFFNSELSARFREAFTAGGGQMTFVRTVAFGDEGHYLFSPAGISTWSPIVDDFLRGRKLEARGEILPLPQPPHIGPPPGLSNAGAAEFRSYLAAAPHKAFAVSAGGGYGWVSRRRDTGTAATDAMNVCQAHSAACRVVMEDGTSLK